MVNIYITQCKWGKIVAYLYKSVHMGAHKRNYVAIGVPGANLYKLVQTCANMRKSLQIGAMFCKLVQTGTN